MKYYYCSKCNAEVDKDATKCLQCGHRIRSADDVNTVSGHTVTVLLVVVGILFVAGIYSGASWLWGDAPETTAQTSPAQPAQASTDATDTTPGQPDKLPDVSAALPYEVAEIDVDRKSTRNVDAPTNHQDNGCIQDISTRLAVKNPDTLIDNVIATLRKNPSADEIKPLIAEAQHACFWTKSIRKVQSCNAGSPEALKYRNKLSEHYEVMAKALDSLYGYFDTRDEFHMDGYKKQLKKAQILKKEAYAALEVIRAR